MTSSSREVICSDAVAWLEELVYESSHFAGSVFTSLPDITEISHLFAGSSVEDRTSKYEAWFIHAAELIFQLLSDSEYAIFLQSDARVQGSDGQVLRWVDKSHLLASAADRTGCHMVWHKIVHGDEIAPRSAGRPNYSHLVCFSRKASYDSGKFSIPDIFARGRMVWSRAIGLDCCVSGIAFLKYVGKTKTVFDPFCGQGTVLAIANAFGLNSIGVEISNKRCRKARTLDMSKLFESTDMTGSKLSRLGVPRAHAYRLDPRSNHDYENSADTEVERVNFPVVMNGRHLFTWSNIALAISMTINACFLFSYSRRRHM